MLKILLGPMLNWLERTWNYDVSYMRHVLRASPGTLFKFMFVTGLVDRKAAPADALAAALLAGTLVEDCGPCTQLCVDMSLAQGVDPQVVRAILADDEPAMGESAALAWRFARASLARDLEASDPLRDEIVRRWGDKGLVAVAMAITTSRVYPTLKYAMGYGKACSKVVVAGADAPVVRQPLAA